MSKTAGLPLRALSGIFGGLFCGYGGLTAAIPVLPSYVKGRFGAANVAAGVVVTGTAFTALLTRPLAGGFADRHGHRLVMRAGALAVGADGALYDARLDLAGLVTGRLLIGAGEAALFTAGAVWAVALAPHDRRGQLIGRYGVSMWGGISAGTLLGGALRHAGYSAVWACCTAIPLIGFVLITAVPAPARQDQRPAALSQRRGLRPHLTLRPAVLPGAGLALAAAGYAGLASFVVLLMRSRGSHQGVLVLTVFSGVVASGFGYQAVFLVGAACAAAAATLAFVIGGHAVAQVAPS